MFSPLLLLHFTVSQSLKRVCVFRTLGCLCFNYLSNLLKMLTVLSFVAFEHSLAGTWNQYDDAIFSQPSLWASICNRFPWLANSVQGPAEGRRMAMMVMLPDWDSISLEEEKMSGHSVLREINAVVYCMSRDMFENGGDYFQRDISGFNVGKVSAA